MKPMAEEASGDKVYGAAYHWVQVSSTVAAY